MNMISKSFHEMIKHKLSAKRSYHLLIIYRISCYIVSHVGPETYGMSLYVTFCNKNNLNINK